MSRFSDVDRTLDMMDELRRRMGWLFAGEYAGDPRAYRAFFEDDGRPAALQASGAGPRINLFDAGSSFLVKADLPGLTEKDIQLSVHNDVLTLAGERKSDAPQGYSTHRRERAPVQFSRSFTLPCKVDPEKTTASLKNGVLTISLAKAPEAQPRKIQVEAR
jgi:HSP20 family protein